jgi:signal transduction histidine kinase
MTPRVRHLLQRRGEASVRVKLALFATALVVLAVAATSLVAYWLIEQQAEQAARARLDHASEFVAREYHNLLENARITAGVLAARQPLRRSLAAEDVEALTAMLQGALRTSPADRIAVAGPDGTSVSEVERGGVAMGGRSLRADEAIAQALRGEPAEGLEVTPDGVMAVVALPIRAGEDILGAVLVATKLDNALVDRLQRAIAFDVTFYAGDRATATSVRLPTGVREVGAVAPAPVWQQVVEEHREVELISRSRGGRVIVRYAPLSDVHGRVVGMYSISAPVAVLFERRTQTLAVFLSVVAVVLALAVAGAAYTAQALTRPVRALVAAVRRIGEGDLATPVPARAAGDEFGVLARAIEEMRVRLQRYAEEQEQLNRLKDQYLFNVAHELKTPLASLVATVELLTDADGSLSEAEQRHFLATVRRSTARLQALVDNLLDLGSLRSGRFTITPRPVSLPGVVAEAIASVQPLLEAREQRVECRAPEPPPVVVADAKRIQQVLVNLLSNAAKYGPAGDTILIDIQERDGAVRVAVTDHGPGIPPEEQPRLFEAYFRSVMASRATPGVGLGLAIVKAIVEAHGGEVGVASAPNQGATFWFTLPREAVPAPAPSAAPRHEPAPGALSAAGAR